MQKNVLSNYLEQNDSWKRATLKNFSGNFLVVQQLQSNFWVYEQATFAEFTSTIYLRPVYERYRDLFGSQKKTEGIFWFAKKGLRDFLGYAKKNQWFFLGRQILKLWEELLGY